MAVQAAAGSGEGGSSGGGGAEGKVERSVKAAIVDTSNDSPTAAILRAVGCCNSRQVYLYFWLFPSGSFLRRKCCTAAQTLWFTSHHAKSHRVYRLVSRLVKSHHTLSSPTVSCYVAPHPMLSRPIPSHHISSHVITSHHIASHFIPFITFHHMASHPIPFYPNHITLHYPTFNIQKSTSLSPSRAPPPPSLSKTWKTRKTPPPSPQYKPSGFEV